VGTAQADWLEMLAAVSAATRVKLEVLDLPREGSDGRSRINVFMVVQTIKVSI